MSASTPATGCELRPLNPATLEPVGSVLETEPDALGEIVAEARLAQKAWGRLDLGRRSQLLRAAAAVLLESSDEIAATIVAETGKPLVEALATELFVSLDSLAWLARRLGRVLQPERTPYPQRYLVHKRAWLHYEPVGVVGVISTWNFPFAIPFTQVATGLAAGNAVVVKPSELTPLSGAWVEEVFRRAGAPPRLVRTVQGPGETVGDALVAARDVAALVFTGSGEVGRVVAERAAARLCPVTLELGGKDPMLVLADADVERTIEGALWGAFSNCGQMCSGVKRIYVERELFERFSRGLAERAGQLRLGRGDDLRTEMGPLVSERRRQVVEELVADAVEHGAELLGGGGRPDLGLPGWFHQPTVLAGEPARARIASEEVFGPVVTVASVENADEGIQRANESSFGLGASVWTRDRTAARAVARRLEAGSVWTNDVAYSYGTCQAPWGGRKGSGYGRTHSRHGLYALSHVKFADVDAGRFAPPWWFPYSERVADGFRGALGAVYGAGVARRAGAVWSHRRGLVELGRRALRRR